MRARMALKYAGIELEHREIELRNKPRSMLELSPKGTVPVLCLENQVIDQSIDIMRWAMQQSDPDKWGEVDEVIAHSWIEKNDGRFKSLLGDRSVVRKVKASALCVHQGTFLLHVVAQHFAQSFVH